MWLAPHLTAPLIGLSNLPPPTSPAKASARAAAGFDRMPNINSSGRMMATAITLKKSCIVAAVNARRNSSERRACPSETSVFVTVVPMLAPMIMGTAVSIGRLPAATRATIVAVVTDDD